jgi:Tol biopolymer transport system component
MPLESGSNLGPYEILAPIGAGGMGEVYKARDTRLNREVAVKILPEHGDRARFSAESRALAALNHPNIVAIHDVGENYLVTELVDGAPWKSSGLRQTIEGDSAALTMAAIAEKEPPELGDDVPAGLKQIVYHCLAKEREGRFQNAGDLAFALRSLGTGAASHSSTALPAVGSRPAMWIPWLAAAICLFAALTLAFVHFSEQPERSRPLVVNVPLPEKTRFAGLNGFGPSLLSPDGTMIAFLAASGQGPDIWIRSLDSLAARKLDDTRLASYPFWSPDSRQIAFFADGKLKRISASGGPALPVCDAVSGRGGDWSEQDIILFAPDNRSPLMQVAASGGIPKPVTSLAKGHRNHRWPVWLPETRRFLYLVLDESTSGSNLPLVTGSLDGEQPREILRTDSRVSYVPPAAGEKLGWLVFVRSNVLLSQRFDPEAMRPEGDPAPIATGVDVAILRQTANFSVSRNGVMTRRSGRASSLRMVWLDRKGNELQEMPGRHRTMSFPEVRLSPSGKWAALNRAEGDNEDIWLMDNAKGVSSRFTFEPNADFSFVWTPDEQSLIYKSEGAGIFKRAADGSGGPRLLYPIKSTLLGVEDLTHDGRFLLLTTQPEVSVDIQVLPLGVEGATPYALLKTEFNELGPRLSPDGKWLAYSSNESGVVEVFVRPVKVEADRLVLGDGKWQVSSGGGVTPSWRSDGRELFFSSLNRGLMSAEIKAGASFAFSPPAIVFEKPTRAIAAAPGGQRFLALMDEQSADQEELTLVVNWQAMLRK